MRLELAVVQDVWRQAREAQHLSQMAEVIPDTPHSEPLPLVSKRPFDTTQTRRYRKHKQCLPSTPNWFLMTEWYFLSSAQDFCSTILGGLSVPGTHA